MFNVQGSSRDVAWRLKIQDLKFKEQRQDAFVPCVNSNIPNNKFVVKRSYSLSKRLYLLDMHHLSFVNI